MREFKEEINAKINVGKLVCVQENYFPINDKLCHQICLYYLIDIVTSDIPKEGMFYGIEDKKVKLEFHWISIDELNKYQVYPTNVEELVKNINKGVQHFIYKE